LPRNCKTLAIVLVLGLLTACGKTTPTIELPCPLRPELINIPEHYDVDPSVQDIVTENYLRLIQYARQLEARACDNDSR